MPSLMHHVGLYIDICGVVTAGRIPDQRGKGKRFTRPLQEIVERIRHLKPQSAGKHKLDTRRERGVSTGAGEESVELHID